MTTILDGKNVRDARKDALLTQMKEFGPTPTLVIITVAATDQTKAYIEQKRKLGHALGVDVRIEEFEEDLSEDDLLLKIGELNNTPGVHGVIVQLPLPDHLDLFRVVEAVDPEKDVDGLTAVNIKKLFVGKEEGIIPATARGILSLLDHYDIDLAGKHAVVVGRSMLAGKPTAHALVNRDVTVTVAHSKTTDLSALSRQADILVTAVGKPNLITTEHVHDKQVVIDIGMNRQNDSENGERVFVGDVAYEEVREKVSAITPVPGGVGPMTVISLFENLADAVGHQHRYQ